MIFYTSSVCPLRHYGTEQRHDIPDTNIRRIRERSADVSPDTVSTDRDDVNAVRVLTDPTGDTDVPQERRGPIFNNQNTFFCLETHKTLLEHVEHAFTISIVSINDYWSL